MGLFDLRNRTAAFGQVRTWTGQDGKRYRDIHQGDDYAETRGNDPVVALESGDVVVSEYSATFGFLVSVRRDDGLIVRYHMLEKLSPLKVGDRVDQGTTVIGRTGASAANATGNHVHVQIEKGGVPVDPRPYITDFLSRIGGATSIGAATALKKKEGDMSPEESARLKNIEGILAALQNDIKDPSIGVFVKANAAAAAADAATAMLQGILNWIEDPNIGIVKRLGDIAAESSRVKQSLTEAQERDGGSTLPSPHG